MTKQQRAVLDVLAEGRNDGTISINKPIKGLELLRKAGIPYGREQAAGGRIRCIIHDLRVKYYWPVGSTSSNEGNHEFDGYFLASNIDELEGTIANLKSRIAGQMRTIVALETNSYYGRY